MTAEEREERSVASDLERQRLPGLPSGLLLPLYGAVGLLPLLISVLQGTPARNIWRELSSGLVMIAFAMMLIQFLLSGRFRHVSGQIGIDVVIRFHQLISFSLLAFVLLHPFLYTIPRLTVDPAGALVMLERMFLSEGLRTGVVAWFLLLALVGMAVWRDRLPFGYEIWRLSHGLGAALIALLSAHHTLAVGTHSQGTALAIFWIVLTGIAVLSLIHVYVVKPLFQRRAPYQVVSNDKVADRMWAVAVEPVGHAGLRFAAGQFAWLNLGHSPFSVTEHPFSMSSAPVERPRIAFTIKESGDFTNEIGKIAPGTIAYVDGPYGNFTLAGRQAEHIVFIAGGVGFAPILSLLRQLRAELWPHRVTVIYGNRVETQILHREELEAMRSNMEMDLYLVLSEPPANWKNPVGELTVDVLRVCLEPIDPDALYFVCGPGPMMDSVEKAFDDLGVPGTRVVAERFKYD